MRGNPLRLSAAAAFAFQAPQLAGCSLVLPQDNDRTVFRTEPGRFDGDWGAPRLWDGGVVNETRPTDLVLHADVFSDGQTLWKVLYPIDWEARFLGYALMRSCRSYWWVSYIAAILYLIGLWFGESWMKHKQPYNLKVPLALWNLFLAVFSFIGMVRTAPHLFLMLKEFGFEYTLCRAASIGYGSGPVGLWTALFIFSKYFELIDTVFLVLRKKKVGFLHWYHHCSVLLYCWHAYVWEMPTGIYFVVMNYTVHAIMYFYYFLAAVAKPPSWSLMVTLLQLSQMAVGIAITVTHLHMLVYSTVPRCDGHIPNLSAALGMYASYFILFAQFLINRYCMKRGPGKAAKGLPEKKGL